MNDNALSTHEVQQPANREELQAQLNSVRKHGSEVQELLTYHWNELMGLKNLERKLVERISLCGGNEDTLWPTLQEHPDGNCIHEVLADMPSSTTHFPHLL